MFPGTRLGHRRSRVSLSCAAVSSLACALLVTAWQPGAAVGAEKLRFSAVADFTPIRSSRRGDAACAPFHSAHAARFTRQRAAAELQRYTTQGAC